MKFERAKELIPAAVLVTAVFALYVVTAGFGFLRFDDPDYTFACPFVKNGLTLSGVKEAFANARHGAIWMPLTWLSYMIDIAFFGPGAGPHHVVNALLHACNAVLLLKLARRLGDCAARGATRTEGGDGVCLLRGRAWPWGLVALVAFWALHPQRVEAVAWIASRKELLWAFFTLWGLLAWHKGRGLVACGCCALACMCKPTAMVFPFLALLVGREKTVGGVRALGALLPVTALAAITGGLAVYSQMHPEGMAAKDLFYAGWGERLLNAAVAIGLYVWQMVVPVGLHLDYRAVPGGWPVDGVLGLVAFGVVAGLVICAARGATRTGGVGDRAAIGQGMIWGLGWFLVALAPTLGIFGSFGEHARADRFLYVPAMFLPLAFARWRGLKEIRGFKDFRGLKGFGSNLSGWLPFLAAGYLLFLAAQAVPLILSYRSDEVAFSRTLVCDPNHGRALAHVGEARCAAAYDPTREGAARAALLDEGIVMLRRSQERRPRDVTAGKLAYALMKRGRVADWDEIRSICSGQRTMGKGQRGRLNDASRGQGTEPLIGTLADRDQKGQALEALGTAELRAREWQAAAEHLSRSILAPGRFYSAEDAQLKLAFALHNGGQRASARRIFGELSQSTRADISARAEEAGAILRRSPNAMLFW